METCYKAVKSDVLHDLRLTSDRFGIEPEITARLARYGARIYEVPISYHGRTYAEGKSIGWRDGVQALWLIFKFRFIDTKSSEDAGHTTLESLSAAPAVAKWTIEQFSPYLGHRVFEAGSGMGNLTAQLIDRESLTVADIDERHLRSIEKRFGHLENIKAVQGDLQDPSFYEGLPGDFDSVLCVNVLEHLDDPEVAVSEFYKATRSGGKVLILVPAHEWLLSEADTALGHRTRYTEDRLRELLEGVGYVVEDLYQFNRLGVLGWYTNKVFGRTDIAPWQAKLFAFLMPLARLVDGLTFLPGLSLIAIGKRP
jgi:SAM-dependent methyltransferase